MDKAESYKFIDTLYKAVMQNNSIISFVSPPSWYYEQGVEFEDVVACVITIDNMKYLINISDDDGIEIWDYATVENDVVFIEDQNGLNSEYGSNKRLDIYTDSILDASISGIKDNLLYLQKEFLLKHTIEEVNLIRPIIMHKEDIAKIFNIALSCQTQDFSITYKEIQRLIRKG